MHTAFAAASQRSGSATRASAHNVNCRLLSCAGTEGGTEFDEMPNGMRHIILLFLGEGVPPIPEFIGELDLHTYSMPYTE